MKKYISILIVSILIISIFVGCSEEAKENVIATIDGEKIIEQDVEYRIKYTEISEKLYTGDTGLKTDFTKNDAFNQLVRGKVLYSESIKLGYEAKTKEKIMEMIEESKSETDISNVGPEAKENINEKYGDSEEFEEEVLKEYGYSSMENFYEENVDILVNSFLITDLAVKYKEELEKELSKENINNEIGSNKIQESFTNYTEHLLKNSDVKIKDEDYEIKYYGDEWEYKDLDLKNN